MGISSDFILQNWDVENKQDWGNKIRSKTEIPLKTMPGFMGQWWNCLKAFSESTPGRVHPDENVTFWMVF